MQQEQNPYDFITNPEQPKRKSLLPAGNSQKQRILIAAGGFSVLVIIGIVVFSLIAGFGAGNGDQLLRVAQQHAELIRIAERGTKDAVGSDTKNLAITTKLSLQSTQNDLLEAIRPVRSVSAKELEAGADPTIDTALTEAAQNNRFDEAFTEVLTRELREYQGLLQDAYDASGREASRQIYGDIFVQASVLVPPSPTE